MPHPLQHGFPGTGHHIDQAHRHEWNAETATEAWHRPRRQKHNKTKTSCNQPNLPATATTYRSLAVSRVVRRVCHSSTARFNTCSCVTFSACPAAPCSHGSASGRTAAPTRSPLGWTMGETRAGGWGAQTP